MAFEKISQPAVISLVLPPGHLRSGGGGGGNSHDGDARRKLSKNALKYTRISFKGVAQIYFYPYKRYKLLNNTFFDSIPEKVPR